MKLEPFLIEAINTGSKTESFILGNFSLLGECLKMTPLSEKVFINGSLGEFTLSHLIDLFCAIPHEVAIIKTTCSEIQKEGKEKGTSFNFDCSICYYNYFEHKAVLRQSVLFEGSGNGIAIFNCTKSNRFQFNNYSGLFVSIPPASKIKIEIGIKWVGFEFYNNFPIKKEINVIETDWMAKFFK